MAKPTSLAAAALCGLALAAPASAAPAAHTCRYLAGSGGSRILMSLTRATPTQCSAFAGAVQGRLFTGHVDWPVRCTLTSPTTHAILQVRTVNGPWGRAICTLAVQNGWRR